MKSFSVKSSAGSPISAGPPVSHGSVPKQPSAGFKVLGDGNTTYAAKPEKPAENGRNSKFSPLRIIMFTLALGVFGYLYIAHVFYTQGLLTEVNRLKGFYEEVRLDHSDAKLTFERMTGPAEVYERAKSIGLIDAGPADRIITRSE